MPAYASGKSRDGVIDIAKGIGILLVVAFHSEMGWLPGLDMPLFFLISGFFAPKSVKYTFVEALAKRSSTLLGMTGFFSALPPASRATILRGCWDTFRCSLWCSSRFFISPCSPFRLPCGLYRRCGALWCCGC